MTAEQTVRAVYPGAHLERQRTHGGKTYYIVRNAMRANVGDGDTKAKAWKDAAYRIERAKKWKS